MSIVSHHRQYRHYRQSYSNVIRRRVIMLGVVLLCVVAAGGTALVAAVIVNNVQNLAAVVLAGVLAIGTLGCWGLVALLVWRWFNSNWRQRTSAAPPYMNTVPQPSPVPTVHHSAGVRSPPPQRGSALSPLSSLTAAQFEQEVAWVFSQRFGLRADVVGRSNDGGIDVNLYDVSNRRVAIIQAKHYDERKALNPGFLRELDSTKRRTGVPSAYLVTTARFSAAVSQQAEQMAINLVDGQLFDEWRRAAYAAYRR